MTRGGSLHRFCFSVAEAPGAHLSHSEKKLPLPDGGSTDFGEDWLMFEPDDAQTIRSPYRNRHPGDRDAFDDEQRER